MWKDFHLKVSVTFVGSVFVPGPDLLGHVQHTLNQKPHGVLKFLVDTVTSKKDNLEYI